LDAPARYVALAALHSGCRLGELVDLQRAAVDLERRTIGLVHTKNGKPRTVPVGRDLADVVRRAMRRPGAPVFLSGARRRTSDGTLTLCPYTVSGFSSHFRQCVQRAGVEDFHFHDLRHTFAT